MSRIFIFLILLVVGVFAKESNDVIIVNNWSQSDENITSSSVPSYIKYYKYYDSLPSEITTKLFDKKDLHDLADKKLFIGYGTVEKKGKNCRVFPASTTGLATDTTVCLPYWRIEREYLVENSPVKNLTSVTSLIPKVRPPIRVDVCDKYSDAKQYPGGPVSCVTYYSKLVDKDCYDNPLQAKCFITTCAKNLDKKCTFVNVVLGNATDLHSAVSGEDTAPIDETTAVNLSTIQYDCPAGPIVDNVKCVDKKQVLMYPEKCEDDNLSTPLDDAVYEYCDKTKPIRDTQNNITGFSGHCKNGKAITCKANQFDITNKICLEPIYAPTKETIKKERTLTRSYRDYSIDWISGEPDIYSEKDNCLRLNNILDSRKQNIYVNIKASGSLDDDIYILRHKPDGEHTKIYCNMQHAPTGAGAKEVVKQCLQRRNLPYDDTNLTVVTECGFNPDNNSVDYFTNCLQKKNLDLNTSNRYLSANECVTEAKEGTATKAYNGSLLQCVRNNGSYNVNKTSIPIDINDIVTIQQNSEQESNSPAPFSLGRNHFRSTKVFLNGKTITPEVSSAVYPNYPLNGSYLKTWDNTTAVMTILFPFSGIYELYFYNKNGDIVAKKTITPADFKEITATGYAKLKLGQIMDLASNINEKDAGRDDAWVEWGGGVYGGRDSVTGAALASPNDTYSKEHSVYSIIVKDLILNKITPIQMVYPIPYPNQIYISKLDVYEKRKYRCYGDFDTPEDINVTSRQFVCNSDETWQDYKVDSSVDISKVNFWNSNDICEQNCRTNFQKCTKTSNEDYRCPINGFSSLEKNTCDAKCFVQNTCDVYEKSSCKKTSENVSNAVTDFTGKTLFTLEKATYACEKSTDTLVGCAKYGIKKISGVLNYQLGNVGVERLNPISFEDAIAKSNMMNLPKHIWSGWHGECIKGMKMDASYLSNPMTIASYAMSAYSAYSSYAKAATATKTVEATTAANTYQTSKAAVQAGQKASTLSKITTNIKNAYSSVVSKIDAMKQGFMNNPLVKGVTGTYTKVSDSLSKLSTSLGSSVDKFTDTITKSINNNSFVKSVSSAKSAISNAISKNSLVTGVKGAYTSVSNQLTKMSNSIYSSVGSSTFVKDVTNYYEKTKTFLSTKLVNNSFMTITTQDLVKFGVKTAVILAAPSESDYTKAQDLLSGFAGEESSNIVQYNSCMASIGLTMPNLVSWSFRDINGTSDQLVAPYKNPISMTPEQLATIASIYGEEWVMNNYLVSDKNSSTMQVLAITPDAYITAGQTICAGAKTAAAMNQLMTMRMPKDPPKTGNSTDKAISIGVSAVSIAFPITGFAMQIAVDLYTNMLTKVNTCDNEKDAIAKGLLDYKTNLFYKHDQCHDVNVECSAKLFFGKCVQHKYNKCCFDSSLTKVFAEGTYEELSKSWDRCNDISISDIKNISFQSCKEGEDAKRDHCFPLNKYSEFKQTLFRQAAKNMQGDAQNLVNQVTDSIVAP